MPCAPQQPFTSMPGNNSQPMAGNWSAPPVAAGPPMPVTASLATGTVKPNPPPRPTIRLQAPDALEIRPAAPFVLPSPQALGIRPAAPAPDAAPSRAASTVAVPALDWNDAHARLQRLGASGFHLVRLRDGTFQAICMLPTSDQRLHQTEAVAGSEAAAVQAMLADAESWALTRK
jgi:hypothetical protein